MTAPIPLSTETKTVEAAALEYFTAYFVQNYPGPTTIIANPKWHAPKVFQAATWAMKQAHSDASPEIAQLLK